MLAPLILLVYLHATQPVNAVQPSICGLYECLQYNVTETFDDLELRCYPQSKWASISVEGTSMKNAIAEAYRHLLDYRGGRNRQEAGFDITFPNIAYIPTCRSLICPKNYTSSITLPKSFHESHPVPIDGTISVTVHPRFCAYVRSFSGNITELKVREEARLLRLSLALKDLFDFQYDYYFLARYYRSLRKAQHYHEIWFVKR